MESHHYLSRFGRPATVNEDPTGTLCEVPSKWLHQRLDEKAPPARAADIWAVTVRNALPFIGFGFLDNLIMILALLASKIGIKDPDLTPSQMASGPVRWASNFGRAAGVMIGCILGMFPLFFLPGAEGNKRKEKKGDEADGHKEKDTK